jgi:hypothetical protein
MISYEFWRHGPTGEVWAVKLKDGIVVACAGPLHYDDIDSDFLDSLDYGEDGAAAIEASREEYVPLMSGP